MNTDSPTYFKHPRAEKDYTIGWSDWLEGDTITDSEWLVPSPLTLFSEAFTTTTATAWLSGGVMGQKYTVVNKITTASSPPRVEYRKIMIHCILQ